jgi:hypothetical protein
MEIHFLEHIVNMDRAKACTSNFILPDFTILIQFWLSVNHFKVLPLMWGPHTIDRFANSENTEVRRFNSRYWNPSSESVDAFTQLNVTSHLNNKDDRSNYSSLIILL